MFFFFWVTNLKLRNKFYFELPTPLVNFPFFTFKLLTRIWRILNYTLSDWLKKKQKKAKSWSRITVTRIQRCIVDEPFLSTLRFYFVDLTLCLDKQFCRSSWSWIYLNCHFMRECNIKVYISYFCINVNTLLEFVSWVWNVRRKNSFFCNLFWIYFLPLQQQIYGWMPL